MQLGWEAYEKVRPLPTHVREAVKAIIACRTKALGGHVQGCPDGHFTRHWYNSCKHRLCPQCAYILVERWLRKQKARLLGCDHYHMIFTIPHQLHGIWLHNVKPMTNLLFLTVRDTLFNFMADEKHCGAQPGIISHRWRSGAGWFLAPAKTRHAAALHGGDDQIPGQIARPSGPGN